MNPTHRPAGKASLEANNQASQEPASQGQEAQSLWAELVSPIGYILAVSYPVLALSTGTRAVYQLFFKDGATDVLPAAMSAVAAVCYLLATIGFVYRRRWSWWLSVSTLGFESAMTLLVGTWSLIDPAFFGHTVWRYFGADYGFFPFFQPLLGLLWLFWPETRRQYGFEIAARAMDHAESHS